MWLRERPLHVALPAEFGHVRVVHAGMVPGVPVAAQRRDDLITIRTLLPDGNGSALAGARGSPSWAASWPGPEHLVFGHDARRKLQRHAHATGLDSACVYGGKLTALILHHTRPLRGNVNQARDLYPSHVAQACRRSRPRSKAWTQCNSPTRGISGVGTWPLKL